VTAATDQHAETVQWHTNRNRRHTTRHPEPEQWTDKWAVEDFTEMEKLQSTAIHEAAHTVLLATAGVPIYSVTVRTMSEAVGDIPSGETHRGPFRVQLQSLLVGLCAGERAEDRWLRETGKWNVRRAWAAERSAIHDREEVDGFIDRASGKYLTCQSNGAWNDLATLHEHTDRALAEHWDSVTDMADALVQDRHLDARQIAWIARVDNAAASLQ
jgi:hypothetical protein